MLVLDAYRLIAAGQLESLREMSELDLSGQGLWAIPPEIGQLIGLRHLRLNGNLIIGLPPEIGQLTNLQRLILSGNQLTSLPAEIGQLTNLQQLSVSENRLTHIPREIGQLTDLQQLTLSGNQLTSLPAEIGQLTDLQQLTLSGNQLTSLPAEIGHLACLRKLSLDSNWLSEVPPEIGRLVGLEELTFSGNRLICLPPEIRNLTNLRRLALDSTGLSELTPEIGKLIRLERLDLSRNRLSSLPQEIAQLAQLRQLSLNANRLSGLPPEIGQLIDLQQLQLSNNKLTGIPRELVNLLVKGMVMEVDGNPLREPFPELISRGTAALISYLGSLDDAIPQYEAKVLFVGEGNVGKTSLVAALQSNPFVEGRDTTHGIEIHALTLQHPDVDVPITLRTWDFGGQEVYRVTHQFFFSRRALYLVVWNSREGQEQNEVEGWLRRIRLRIGRDVPVLVVATHCEERRPELDYPSLQRDFSEMLVGHHAVDNRNNAGIACLREQIAATASQLPQMGQLFSLRWAAARDEILALAKTEPQIAHDEFVATCQRHHLANHEIGTLTELLHDLGQIIYYGDDDGLRDIIVLNPEWLTKAISYVLEDKLTRDAQGVLDHARLKEIWQKRPGGTAYPLRFHPYFLRLMEKFDVSYRLEDDDQKSLVAQLVPYERPETPWRTGTPAVDGVRTLRLICRLSESAPGLIAWLTVRLHHASTGKHWRTGVFLRHPIASYASEALLELEFHDDRNLIIEVRAPSPDLFFNVVRDTVENLINRRWPGIFYELLVPCPSRDANQNLCPAKFTLRTLLRARELGKTEIYCLECETEHNAGVLLTGFTAQQTPLWAELDRIHEEIRKISGGVVRMEQYAADAAESTRRIMKAVNTEITDCPRLFTLSLEKARGAELTRFAKERYRLVLWCEHPGHWHSCPAASYLLTTPKDWLSSISPYAVLVFKVLRLMVPIAAAAAGVVLTQEQLSHAAREIELMKVLVEKFPHEDPLPNESYELSPTATHIRPAEGQGLRAFRALLLAKDPVRAFGGLRRVNTSSGEFIWVCDIHYREYDPGLPQLPGPEYD